MWTKAFWRDLAERGIRTFCQSAAAALTAAGTGLIDTDWVGVLSIAGMAGVVSALTSMGWKPDHQQVEVV